LVDEKGKLDVSSTIQFHSKVLDAILTV